MLDVCVERPVSPGLPLMCPEHIVAPMSGEDIPLASAMAVDLLPSSRLAQLGVSFMSALFHAALDHPDTIALKALSPEGRPVGFCLASADVDGFQSTVRPRVVPAITRALLSPRRLKLIPSFVSSLFEAEPQPHIPAELLLLYVEPSIQRHGIGRLLTFQFEAALQRRGASRYRVAVRKQLRSACAFYAAAGFTFEQERVVLRQPMAYFVRNF